MAGIEIGTLRLRGPPHLATRAAFRIEDGLRTELADSQRLVLIRRMRAERHAASGRAEERSGAIRLAYSAATRDARHGRDAGDGAFLNCVWFESAAEARRLLLAELLAGRRPSGWFWKLAVPEWRGRGLEAWLVDIVARALGGGQETDSLALILFVLEQQAVELVVRAVRTAVLTSRAPTSAPIRPASAGPARAEEERVRDGAERPAGLHEAVAELRARLPALLCDRVETLAQRLEPAGPAADRLLERMLLQASPSLALAPDQLRELAWAWSELLRIPAMSQVTSGRSTASPAAPPLSARTGDSSSPPPGNVSDRRPPGDWAAAPTSVFAEPPEGAPKPARSVDALFVSPSGLSSDAAGLWLAVPSLIRLGFREWLAERPTLLRRDAGRTLLRAIARHHRVADDDPALAAFETPGSLGELPDWARLWRKGLDGWLRRRTRIPLHRLIWRRGDMVLGDGALTLRFPLEAADLRLRRRALDVDPGWVDWLGLSVRYRYEGKAG